MTLIAKNIRWFRKQQQISQTEFASIFGITRASVGAYEEGRAEPKLELISRFAKYYQVDLSTFIDKDMSLSKEEMRREEPVQPSNVDPTGKSSANASFVQEILETAVSKRKQENSIENRTYKNEFSKKLDDNDKIVFYQSVNEFKYLNKSQWPFFSGCDAVFECTPHLERDSMRFRDGVFFLCIRISQSGIYKGVFIEQDRNRLCLLEGEVERLEDDKKLWRVLYTVDSINSIREQ